MLQEVLKGVHVIDTYANTALLTEQRLVLVDTSSDESAKKILDTMKSLKVQPRDLTTVFITHTHGDHASGLHAIKQQAPNAKVVAHEVEAPFVAREKPYPGPPRPAAHKGVPVDVRVKDGAAYDGFTVIHTPGHTPGSMALLDPARRLLLAGDAVRTEGVGLGPMEDIYNYDPRQHRASIKKLAGYDFDALVCGHGPPILSGAGARLKTLAKGL